MKKFTCLAVLAIGALLAASGLTASSAHAIPPGSGVNSGGGSWRFQPSRPTVSPYLQLANRGGAFGNPAINYFTFIQPQLQQQSINQQQQFQMQQLQQQLQSGQQPVYGQPGQQIRSTGYRSWFMTHEGFFGGRTGQQGGGGAAGAAGGRTYQSSRPTSGGR